MNNQARKRHDRSESRRLRDYVELPSADREGTMRYICSGSFRKCLHGQAPRKARVYPVAQSIDSVNCFFSL